MKTAVKCHCPPIKTSEIKITTPPSAGEKVEEVDFSHITFGSTKRSSHFGEEFGSFLKKENLYLPYNPANTIPDIHP